MKENNVFPHSALANVSFDSKCKELTTAWFDRAEVILAINPFPNGISISRHEIRPNEPFRSEQFFLRLPEFRENDLPGGQYHIYREDYKQGLEEHFKLLRSQGLLSQTLVYFGVTTDPFANLPRRFDVTMYCLDQIMKARPGFTLFQTRSPLVVSALGVLKYLIGSSAVIFSLESNLESSIRRYTPQQPAVKDRLMAIRGLREQGILTGINVAPLLPYGHYQRDAYNFAEELVREADFIGFGSIIGIDGEAELKYLPFVKKLVADEQLQWLRPYSFRPLFHAIQNIDACKLSIPVPFEPEPRQLSLFAA
jgi:hypothetical protein